MSITILDVWVPGTPEPQGSLKSFVVKGRARTTSDNPRLKSWRRDVCDRIDGTGYPFLGALTVTAVFWFDRPRGHFGRHGVLPSAPVHKITKPDVDKLCRAALDALTIAGVWTDDSLVVGVSGRKRFVGTGDNAPTVPGTHIVVRSAAP